MPTQDRVGLHQQDRPALTVEHASERAEDRSVLGFEARTGDLASQHGELMAQHEDLGIFGTITTAAQHQQVDHEPDETIETGHAFILAALEPCRSHHIETQANRPDEFSAPTGRHPRRTHPNRFSTPRTPSERAPPHPSPVMHARTTTQNAVPREPRIRA